MPFPVDIKFVQEAQRKLGVLFPASYVNRIVRSNGGELSTPLDSWSLFPVLDTSDRKRLARTCDDIVRQTRLARERPGIPASGVAIANNGCGDYLVLMPEPSDAACLAHEVFCWRRDNDELESLADDLSDLARGG